MANKKCSAFKKGTKEYSACIKKSSSPSDTGKERQAATLVKPHPTKRGSKIYTTKVSKEFKTSKGKRWYEGEGKSTSKSGSRWKAIARAQGKAVNTPSDSLRTGGVLPYSKPKPKPKSKAKKKKGLFGLW